MVTEPLSNPQLADLLMASLMLLRKLRRSSLGSLAFNLLLEGNAATSTSDQMNSSKSSPQQERSLGDHQYNCNHNVPTEANT